MFDFNATAILMEKVNDAWTEKEIEIKNVQSLREVFEPHNDNIEQVNLDKYRKVYYSMGFLNEGIDAKLIDMNDETHYMVSPLLLVQCDDSFPKKISPEVAESIKKAIDFH